MSSKPCGSSNRASKRIEVLSEPSGPSIYLDIGLDTLVPLAVCGEGMVRLFSIILELVASRNGVLLIDEIDNGLHYSVMPKLWELLGELVEKHQVQVFGTTHNDDIMRSALEAFAGQRGDARTIPDRQARRPSRHGRLQRGSDEGVLEITSRCADERQDPEAQAPHRRGTGRGDILRRRSARIISGSPTSRSCPSAGRRS